MVMEGKFQFPVADGSRKPPDQHIEEWSSPSSWVDTSYKWDEIEGEGEDPPDDEAQDDDIPYLLDKGGPPLRLGEARAEPLSREPPQPDYPDVEDKWFMNMDAIWCQNHVHRYSLFVPGDS